MTAIRHARRRPTTPRTATWPGPLVEAIPRPRTGEGGVRTERNRRRRASRRWTPPAGSGRRALLLGLAVLGLALVLVLVLLAAVLLLPGPAVIDADAPDAAPIGVALAGSPGGASAVSAAVDGSPGLYPGGSPTEVTVALRNVTGTRVLPRDLRVIASSLPLACPPSAWTVRVRDALPAVAAHGLTATTVRVGLRADAPDTCQGRTAQLQLVADVRSSGNHRAGPGGPQAQASVSVRTATLGAPTLSAAPIDGGIGLAVDPATATGADGGPHPDAVVVDAWGPDDATTGGTGRRTVCRRVTAGSCRDVAGPSVSVQKYAVTARLGEHWTRQGPALGIHTPPPLPHLSDGPTVVLTAPAAVVGYTVQVVLDDREAPLLLVDVPTGASITRTLDTSGLTPGRHSLLAITDHAGERTVGDPLTLVVGG